MLKNKLIKLFLAVFICLNYAVASEEKILDASNIFQLMLRSSNANVPDEILKSAQAVVIIPNSFRIGFIVSGAGGSGIMSVRNKNGWSYPVFVNIGGGNIGLQAGVEKSNKLIVFMTIDGVNQVVNNGMKLGADATVAAGPIGASKDNMVLTADVYTYTQGKGLFAGVSLGGLMISIDDETTMATYGNNMNAKSIISGDVTPKESYAAETFLNILNRY